MPLRGAYGSGSRVNVVDDQLHGRRVDALHREGVLRSALQGGGGLVGVSVKKIRVYCEALKPPRVEGAGFTVAVSALVRCTPTRQSTHFCSVVSDIPAAGPNQHHSGIDVDIGIGIDVDALHLEGVLRSALKGEEGWKSLLLVRSHEDIICSPLGPTQSRISPSLLEYTKISNTLTYGLV